MIRPHHRLSAMSRPRRRPALLRCVPLVLALAFAAQEVRAQAVSGDPAKLGRASDAQLEHDPDHVLVKLRQGADPRKSLPAGAEPIFGRWHKVPVLPAESAPAAMHRKSLDPDVEMVELNYVFHALGTTRAAARSDEEPADEGHSDKVIPNDPLWPLQPNLALVQAPAAWELASGAGVTVAVIDTGVSRGQDLACRRFVHELNAITNQSGPGTAADDNGHGTHVAGTIAQCTNNGVGVAGIAFAADLMPVKVLGANGMGTVDDIAQGIDWARQHGAGVINLSLGAPCGGRPWPACGSSIQNEAIAEAALADIVIVAAAGNENQSVVGTPANHPEVIAVGAVGTFDGVKTGYSNYGSALELVAPGGDSFADANVDGAFDGILQETLAGVLPPQLIPGRCIDAPGPFAYCMLDGTSMASPHVAGAAALLRSYRPEATRQQVQAALQYSALDLGPPGIDSTYGAGLLQIADALHALDVVLDALPGFCLPGDFVLCLGDGRFAVSVAWRADGPILPGRALPLTSDTGYFWFFDPANVEIVVKVLDACGHSGRHWVFASGLTNVEAEIRVLDTLTGVEKAYYNPLGSPFLPVLDTDAFSPCL